MSRITNSRSYSANRRETMTDAEAARAYGLSFELSEESKRIIAQIRAQNAAIAAEKARLAGEKSETMEEK